MSHLKWLVVRDLNMIESATFWKDGPEIATGELQDRGHRDRGVLLPRGAATSEKAGTFTQTQRMLQWHHKAVEPPGRLPERAAVLLRARPADPAAAGRLDRRAGPAAARPDLGLPGRRARRARRRGGARGDQRLPPHRRQGRPAALGLHRDEAPTARPTAGCWIYTGVYADGVNQAADRKPGRRAGPGRPRVGLGVAGEPAHPLQPRLGRPRRQAVERAQGATSGGTRRQEVDRPRRARTSRSTRRPSYRPEPGRGGPAGARR